MDKKVQAIILAGGKGTRLMPLTQNLPKPMIKILGKTVLGSVLDNLEKTNVRNVCVTSMYLPDSINKCCESRNNVSVIKEEKALGTAGAVKNAYDKKSDCVLVLSGDGVFDFDIQKIINFHFENSSDVTIVTHTTENPLEYGMVVSDANGKITYFLEKPGWRHVITNRVNTGIYVINKDILDLIPQNTEFDFSKNLFPKLLDQGYNMYCVCPDGYWCDIGTLEAYFSCCCDALDGNISNITNDGLSYDELCSNGVDVQMPVYVSKNAKIGKNVHIGPYCVISDNAELCDGCDVSYSIILNKAKLLNKSSVFSSIVGTNSIIGENCLLSEGTVTGDNSIVKDSSITKKYSRIYSDCNLTEDKNMNINFSGKDGTLFSDNGIIYAGKQICTYYDRLGFCIGKVTKSQNTYGECARLGVMCDFENPSSFAAESILCGARQAEIHTYNFGKGTEAMCMFASKKFLCNTMLYITTTNSNTSIKVFDSNGNTISDSFENAIEKHFLTSNEITQTSTAYPTDNIQNLEAFYYAELINSVRPLIKEKTLSDFECHINFEENFEENIPSRLLLKALTELGARVNTNKTSDITFFISPNGTNAYVKNAHCRADFQHICAMLIKDAADRKIPVSLPASCPQVYKTILSEKTSGSRSHAEDWLTDALFSCLRLCCIINKSNRTLSSLASEIPEFDTYVDTYVGNKNRAAVMEKLSHLDSKDTNETDEGIRLSLAGGSVTIIPSRVSGFRIISESKNFEAAKELCTKIEDIIKTEK